MNIHEAFSDFIGARLTEIKTSPKFTELLKQAEKKDNLLLQMLDGAQSEIYLDLQKINQQIYVNDDLDAYKAGFLDGVTLFNMQENSL